MFNFVMNNKKRIIVSLISIVVLFLGLTFFVRKGNNSLTERQRRLMNYDHYQTGDELVNGTDYVTFDAYFYENIAGTPTKIRGEYLNVNKQGELWLDLHVFGDVTLKDAQIEFVNSNVKTSGYFYKSSVIPYNTSVPSTGGKINLSSTISGSTFNNKVIISENVTNDLGSFSKNNKVILTGTVIKPDNTEVNITKEVTYAVDWYFDDLTFDMGSGSGSQNFPYIVVHDCLAGDGTWRYHHEWTNKNYFINYNIRTYTNNPFIKTANFEAIIPDLNGYDPLNVKITSTDVEYNYDPTTQTLTATKTSTLEGTLLTKNTYSYRNNGIYYNDWNIEIEYPKEVEDESEVIQIPTTVYYELYKLLENGNITTITTDSKSYVYNYDYEKPMIRRAVATCDGPEEDRLEFRYKSTTGNYSSLLRVYYVNKTAATKLYNGDSDADLTTDYLVKWDVNLSYFDKFEEDSIKSLSMSDAGADIINDKSLDKISTYKSLKFIGAERYLGTNGYVKIINNDTDEVIHILTALDWNNVYTFTGNISSIRLETSELVDKTLMKRHYDSFRWQDSTTLDLFEVEIVKSINNQKLKNTFTVDEFNALTYISSKLNISADRYHSKTDTVSHKGNNTPHESTASYRNLQSATVSISANPSTIDTTQINNLRLTISTGEFHDIVEGYKNGEFLVVLPDSILDFDINNVNIDQSDVQIVGYEKVTLDGHKCIRILTENDNQRTYNIVINADIVPDARLMNKNDSVILYAYNPGTDLSTSKAVDKYDIDHDGSTTDYQNYATTSIKLSAPNEIITTTTINYKDLNDNVSTVVSPMTADVNPVEDKSDAEIEIGITNNSLFPTQDFKVIGKVGFVGNTYQIGDGDLGSEFNVKIVNNGIKVPSALEGKTTIYYSTNEAPTEDINNPANGWTKSTDIQNYDNIKTYMIVIDDYTLPVGEKISFTYDVDMPNNTANINKKTYFTHGVYYNIDTGASGLLASSVGGAKLGINIARKYDVELTNYKFGTDYYVSNSKFLAVAKDTNGDVIDQKLFIVNNGKATAKDLYAGYEYELTQLDVENPLILDEEVKKFKITNGANDELFLSTEGTYKSATLENTHLVSLVLENETTYNVVINLTDLEDGSAISNAAFSISGKGLGSGYANYTNTNGELYLQGLYLNEEYEISQRTSPGHLPYNNYFKVMLKRNKNNEISIAVQKKPTIEYYDIENGFTYEVNQWNSAEINYIYRKVMDTYTTSRGYFKIDLSEFEKDYYIYLNYNKYYNNNNGSRYGYFRSYVLKEENPDASPYNYAASCGSEYCSNSVYIRKTNDTNQSTITGGNIYYLYLTTYNGQATLNNNFSASFYVKNDDYEDEYVAISQKTNYSIDAADRVLESVDANGNYVPTLTVDVKNKKIPTYTLEITKKDSETGEPLAGAQYKISGGTLPESGKYITTDENGKATIELEESINIDYNLTTDWSGWTLLTDDDNYYGKPVTVEEIVAPVGYQVDTKKIVFTGYQKHYADCDYNNQTCDLSTYQVSHYLLYSTDSSNRSEAEFKSFTYDDATNTYKVTLEDNPIIRVTKKDSETGELLPNTLFALYKVETANGVRLFSPATDSTGNIVGKKITIDGTDYYTVATNSNGALTLSLPAGQYQLKEVQASDEKYTLDNTVYYFGVGETVPYSAKGINFVGSYDMEGYDYSDYHTQNTYHTTSDGGIIFTSDPYAIKYDKDFNIEWKTDLTTQTYYNYEIHTPEGVRMASDVDGDNNRAYLLTHPHQIYEAADGSGYYVLIGSYEYIYGGMVLLKLDNDGNIVWQSQKYAWYYVYDYTSICDIGPNENVPDYAKITGDDTHKYCSSDTSVAESYNYFGSYYVNNMIATPDGGAYMVASLPNSRPNWKEGFLLSDGTKVFTRESNEQYSGGLNLYILKYDTNGNLISATEIGDQLIAAEVEYLDNLNLPDEEWNNLPCMLSTYTSRDSQTHRCNYGSSYSGASTMEMYDDGSLLFTPNQAGRVNVVSKFDSNLNLVFFTIIGVNKNSRPSNEQNDYYQGQKIHTTPDGGFTFQTYTTYTPQYSDQQFYKYLPEFNIAPEKTGSTYDGEKTAAYGEWILKYDANGKPEKATEFVRKDVNPTKDLLYGNNDKYRVISSDYNTSYVDVGDGYIVTGQFNPWCSSCHYPTTLKSGEVVHYSDRFFYDSGNSGYNGLLIYKIDYDGGVEWIKQYYVEGWMNSNWYLYQPMYIDSLGRLHYPIYAYNTGDSKPFIEEITNDGSGIKLYNTSTQGTNGNMRARYYDMVFELSDEVLPSGPEAYTLNIENNRKEYSIISTSSVGGTIKVTKPDGTESIINNGTLETVKYGDDNINTITITPDDDYDIASIEINGEPASYTVNPDGTITLNTIENIRETKTINVTFIRGVSKVIVKHYLKDTTTSVFGDEIITGIYNNPYVASPKSSELYGIPEENGEPILPANMEGTFAREPITVIFYYVKNEVELRTNYYVDGTEIELAPTNVERKVIGSSYQSNPLDIDNYEFTRTIGNPTGTLNNSVTEVTHMYREITESTITIRHVDKATNTDLVTPITKTVTRHDTYTTDDPVTIPSNYRLTATPANATGPAEDANIEVIYYYEVIPFNISVDKKINSVLLNGERQTITNGKNVSISPKKTDNVIVYYQIDVKNTGDIKATFKVVEEDIPGFVIYNQGSFTKVGNNYELNVELEPGEEKTYEISYKWNQKDYGISTNKVELNDVANALGFTEPDALDNVSEATVETKIPKEVLDTPIVNTIDRIGTSIILFITSMVGIIISIVLIRRKRMN